jgi:hypothetical protein
MRLPIDITVSRNHPLARILCRADVAALILGADGRLSIKRADGRILEAAVSRETTVFPGLVVLRYRIEGCLETIVLPPQALAADAHRHLRVWLGWRVRTA